MSDAIDAMRAVSEMHRQDGAARRNKAEIDFPAAVELAHSLGLCIAKRSPQHYQVFPQNKEWVVNLYPGNQRIKPERKGSHHIGRISRGFDEWTLPSVVQAIANMLITRKANP